MFDLEGQSEIPDDAFEFTFSEALDSLRQGMVITRRGWNGKGMWLLLIEHWQPGIEHGKLVGSLPRKPWIAMRTADGGLVPWLASQTDLLADDWLIVQGVGDVWRPE